MNITIRKMYSLMKKQKSFDRTFGAKFVMDQLKDLTVRQLDFDHIEMSTQDQTLIEIDLEDIRIDESQCQTINDLFDSNLDQLPTPKKLYKKKNSDKKEVYHYSYGLIYRPKKLGSQYILVPCKVPLRNFKYSKADQDFRDNFKCYDLVLQFPTEIDFMDPIDDFTKGLNEIVLKQL
ncbi:hypothetical protein pb186bvf_003460 [Paramecium bursaria]